MSLETENFIQQGILRDMSEGVMVIGLDGIITDLNPAAERILARTAAELKGQSFARSFFLYPENDAFNQTLLDAVYAPSAAHENVVSYFTGTETKQLHVTTSYLRSGAERIALIAVLGDISELTELRDAVKAMETIKALNSRLELRNRLLSETFGRFLSDEIVRQLLDTPNGLALGGRKRQLTVLMSDLRGFTALSERMDAQALLSLLNHYLGEMTEIIQRRGGTIIEFIGDGILAVFGAPAPSDTHAADAVAAAVEMQAEMDAVNAWNQAHGWPPLEMGIGINTGEVIVGNIGSEKRTKYGVVGSQVNLCGRIESYTVGGQVLISPQTRVSIHAPLTIVQEQEVFPKGVAGPLTLSQVTAIGAPYHISCVGGNPEPPAPLPCPIPVTFRRLDGKHEEGGVLSGSITSLSKTGAVLETGEPLEPFDNLRLEAGGSLFAKVVELAPAGYILRFTAVPPGFAAWRRTQRESPPPR